MADRGDAIWDAIVIGAGPAGAFAAWALSSAGRRTLLIERKRLPRYKVCGACISAKALAELQLAGLTSVVDRLPAVPLTAFEVNCSGQKLRVPLPGGIAVSRAAFDSALVEAAVSAGAALRTGTTARVLPVESPEEPLRHVVIAPDAEPERSLSAKVVLVADGLGHSSVKHLDGFESQVSPRSRIGAGAVFASDSHDHPPGTVLLVVGEGGYVGFVCTEDQSLTVAAALCPRFLRAAGSPALAVQKTLQSAASAMPREILQGEWHGTLPLTRTAARRAGHRLLVLGDAAGYVEPFTGEGIAWALRSARLAVPLAVRGMENWTASIENAWAREYRHQIEADQVWCRAVSWLARRRWAAWSIVAAMAACPALIQPLIGRIAAGQIFTDRL